MAKFKIGLVFSDTGGGHRSAVEAIDAAIREVIAAQPSEDEFEIVTDNVVEKTHPVNRAFVDIYNYLLRNNQQWMKYYYWFIHMAKPNDSEMGYNLSGPYLRGWLRQEKPDVVVSVHPMTNQYVSRAMKDVGCSGKTKMITVVTDPNDSFWRGWACANVDLTIAPNDLAKKQLIALNIPEEKIRVMGMPVNPDFLKPPSVTPEDFRHHLGLQRDRVTVCINAGWAGGGNMVAIYRELNLVRNQIQAIILCGHNRRLYETMKKEARLSAIPSAVLPFHDCMPDLMAAVDLMVTKAGGLTTFEAIARRLPMAIDLITPPMPQEARTVDILVEQGLAHAIMTPRDIISVVENLQPVADRNTVQLPSVHSLDRVNAVYEIAKTIVGYCNPDYQPAPEPSSAVELH